jgi:hypothetical protein
MAHQVIACPRPGVLRRRLATLAVAWMISGTVRAQDHGQGTAAGRSAEMMQIAGSLSAFRGEGADRRQVKLRPEPLLRFSDPIREASDASLWAWGEPGRPLALFAMELQPDPTGAEGALKWACEFISLAADPLEVRLGNGSTDGGSSKPVPSPTDRVLWKPTKPGVAFREFPAAPTPARSPTGRLAQMKDLLKRLSCTAHPGEKVVLRLMPHPVVRYAETEAGLVDGAIFAFASGTNPEVLALLEAQGPSPEKASWHYAFARITVAPYEVRIDRREVWSEPYHSDSRNSPSAPYFTTHLPRKTAPSP